MCQCELEMGKKCTRNTYADKAWLLRASNIVKKISSEITFQGWSYIQGRRIFGELWYITYLVYKGEKFSLFSSVLRQLSWKLENENLSNFDSFFSSWLGKITSLGQCSKGQKWPSRKSRLVLWETYRIWRCPCQIHWTRWKTDSYQKHFPISTGLFMVKLNMYLNHSKILSWNFFQASPCLVVYEEFQKSIHYWT